MATLFVPPAVARELLDERQQFTQCLLKACSTDRVCEDWNTELQRIDPRLRMVKAPEYLVIGMPLVPGHYHLIRDNESAPPSVTPVQGPNGEYREPGSDLLDRLRSLDLQNARVVAQHQIERARAQAREEREKLERRAARQGTAMEKWKAVSRTFVSMDRDNPWSQNVAGRRGVEK